MSDTLEAALKYADAGLSVIPVGVGDDKKKPFVTWADYQNRCATKEEIEDWWRQWPNAGIGIITGKISNITVVDADVHKMNEEEKEQAIKALGTIRTPIARSQSGGRHKYFKYREGLDNKPSAIRHIDIRNDGGYIIAPPSFGNGQKKYEWDKGNSIFDCELPEMPDSIYDSLLYTKKEGYKEPQKTTKRHMDFKEGTRDDTLFHVAYHLSKGGMPKEEIEQLLALMCVKLCEPPEDPKVVPIKINSAMQYVEKKNRNMTEEIREWVEATWGHFNATEYYKAQQITDSKEKKKCRTILARLVEEGLIERVPGKNSWYRKLDTELVEMDFKAAKSDTVDISLPFGLMGHVKLYPNSLVVIAGESNAGKTCFLMNTVKMNMNRFDIHYYNSEMGQDEFRGRLEEFDYPLNDWNFRSYERSYDFGDVVKKGNGVINIIDFLEIHDNFWEISGMLNDIYRRLDGAIAIVAIQKNMNVDMGLGGFRGLEKPRLYLSMGHNWMKIVKAKIWANPRRNPNGKRMTFDIYKGCKMEQTSDWSLPALDF